MGDVPPGCNGYRLVLKGPATPMIPNRWVMMIILVHLVLCFIALAFTIYARMSSARTRRNDENRLFELCDPPRTYTNHLGQDGVFGSSRCRQVSPNNTLESNSISSGNSSCSSESSDPRPRSESFYEYVETPTYPVPTNYNYNDALRLATDYLSEFEIQSAQDDVTFTRYNVLTLMVALSILLSWFLYEPAATLVYCLCVLPVLLFLLYLKAGTNRRVAFETYLQNADEMVLILLVFISALPTMFGIMYIFPFLVVLACYISYCSVRISRQFEYVREDLIMSVPRALATVVTHPLQQVYQALESNVTLLSIRRGDTRTRNIAKLICCISSFIGARTVVDYATCLGHFFLHFNLDKVFTDYLYVVRMIYRYCLPQRFESQSIDFVTKLNPGMLQDLRGSELFKFVRKMAAYLIVTVCSKQKLSKLQLNTTMQIFGFDRDIQYLSTTSPDKILDDVSSLWDTGASLAKRIRRGEGLSLLHCPLSHNHFAKLYAEIKERHETDPDSAHEDQEFMATLDEAIELVKNLMISINSRKAPRVNLGLEQHNLLIIRSFHLAKKNSAAMRRMPYAVIIHGNAGIGKSHLLKNMHRLFCETFNYPIGSIYYRGNTKFWDNFNSDYKTIVYDDLGQLKPDKEDDESAGELIRVVNTVGFVTPQAAVEEKGRHSVQARLVLVTTNLANNRLDEYFGYRYKTPSAIARRFPVRIEAILRKKHKDRFGYLKHEVLKLDREAWIFHITQVIVDERGGVTYPPMAVCETLNELYDFMRQRFIEHEQTDTIVSEIDKLFFADISAFCAQSAEEQEESLADRIADCRRRLAVAQNCHDSHLETWLEMGPNTPGSDKLLDVCKKYLVMARSIKHELNSLERGCESPLPPIPEDEQFEEVMASLETEFEEPEEVSWASFITEPANRVKFLTKNALKEVLHRCLPPDVEEEAECARRRKMVLNGALFLAVAGLAISFLWKRDKRDDEEKHEKYTKKQENRVPKTKPIKKTFTRPNVPEPKFEDQSSLPHDPDYELIDEPVGTSIFRDVPEAPNVWKDESTMQTESLLVTVPQQSTTMTQLIEIVKKQTFTCKIGLENGKTRQIVVLGIRGSLFITNAHSLNGWDGRMTMRLLPGDGPGPNILDYKIVTPENRHIDEDTDIAWLNILFRPPVSDIVKYFPHDPPRSRTSGYLVVKEVTGDVLAHPICAIHSQYGLVLEKAREIIAYSGFKTEKGMCGSAVLAQYPQGVCMVGIHSGYCVQDKIASAIPLTQSCVYNFPLTMPHFAPQASLCMNEATVKTIGPLHYKSTLRFIEKGEISYFGSQPMLRSMKTRVCDTFMRKEVEEVFSGTFMEGSMKKFYPPIHFGGYHPFRKALTSSLDRSYFPPELVEQASRMYLSEVTKFLTPELPGISTVCILDTFTALNGAPGVRFIDSVNWKTSAGFGRPGSKRKYIVKVPADEVKLINEDLGEGFAYGVDDVYDFNSDTRAEFDWCLARIKKGHRCSPIFVAHPKDEPVKEDPECPGKARDKVRIFSGCPFPFAVIVRMYFLPLTRLIQLNPKIFECCAGTNCMSQVWGEMHSYLTKFGNDRLIAGDYEQFDKRMEILSLAWAFWVLIELYHAILPSEDQRVPMWAIATDIIFAYTMFRGDLIMFFGNNPSGNPLTVIINSLINSQYMRIAFIGLRPSAVGNFKEFVNLYTYGDDNTMGVHPVADWFNHVAIAEFFAKYGITYTADDKESEIVPFKNISDISFLKRKWVKHASHPWMSCPLALSSVYKSLTVHIPSKTISKESQFIETLDSANREFFQHGKEIFKDGRECVLAFLESPKLEGYPYKPPRFHQLHSQIFGN